MARKPLIAGNWKMNLNHLEALALVQKVAFALPEKYYAKVEVAVLPPFTDIRSVQTLIDGDRLLMVHGAQDLSPHDSGAYTGDVSGSMLASRLCFSCGKSLMCRGSLAMSALGISSRTWWKAQRLKGELRQLASVTCI